MKKTVNTFVESNLLNSKQHVFTNGLSCTTSFLATEQQWIGITVDGKSMIVVFLDFSKPFDNLYNISGVPQSCVLGPLPFILRVNELLRTVDSPMLLYLDDGKSVEK